ncbi:TPA: hypothetical protein QCO88_001709 [Bacillus cereus]|uniref:hypothetical protein n=1 Tax=Bacillus sp. FSL M8-0139 TaxID=2921613 RepID=UPI0030FCF791|nr:hypothetical protein [Bacillus cereus]
MGQTKYTFDINGDYKTQFETYVTMLINTLRESNSSAISNRDVRAKEIKSLTDAYVASIGERPEPKQLEHLADLLIYEELHDTDRMKVRNNEYPIMSDTQIQRRQEGTRQRKGNGSEVPLKAAFGLAADSLNHGIPRRRKRTINEMLRSDRAKSRNKERQQQYREFTKVQAVKVYNERELASCR